jgi:hypothetical protein
MNWIKIDNDNRNWDFLFPLCGNRGILLKMSDGEILFVGDINTGFGESDEFMIEMSDVVAYCPDLIEYIENKIKE